MLQSPDIPQPSKYPSKPLEIGMFFLALAVFLTATAGIILSKKIAQRIETRQAQVSSLIQELGTVRDENQKLQKIVKNNDINFEALARMMKEKSAVAPVTSGVQAPLAQASEISENNPRPKIPIVQAITEYAQALPSDTQFDLLLVGHHDGLTDTLMLARFYDDDQTIRLISMPRDLFVGGRKINEYYQLYGIAELMKQIEAVSGIIIDRYAVVNMTAFTKIIDAVSGIDIDVEKDIVDALYPRDRGYETYSIAKGQHHFDGQAALRFARSRGSTSDFDRAKRQQKILEALKQRILELRFLENLEQAKDFYEGLFSLLETDIGFLEGLQYLQKYEHYAMKTGDVLSTANFLYPTRNLQGQYILLPKSDDFSAIHQYIREPSEN